MFRRAKEKPMTFLQKIGRMKSVCVCACTHTYAHAYMHQKYLDEGALLPLPALRSERRVCPTLSCLALP